MNKEETLKTEGTVIECFPNTTFKVELQNGKMITGYLSGKMRQNYIKILKGDKVSIEIGRYDLTKGRITYRFK